MTIVRKAFIFLVSLTIRKAGILTTIQDLGRFGAMRFGVNRGGVMDTSASRIANILVGNDETSAVLEMHFPAPEIEFRDETVFAISGAGFDSHLDSKPIPNWTAVRGPRGSVLRFRGKRWGSRAYLAVSDGFKVDKWLGSASTNLVAGIGGVSGRKVTAGALLDCETTSRETSGLTVGPSIRPRYSRFPTVRIIPGNEFRFLTATSERDFLRGGFTLTNDCDRMGYRLSGKALHLLDDIDMVSAATTFGTIQLLPDGQLIILMADHQTSGGYPRMGTVVPVDLPLLAQCGPGDGVSFEIVTIEDAERLVLRFETELNFLRAGCRLQEQNAKGRSQL